MCYGLLWHVRHEYINNILVSISLSVPFSTASEVTFLEMEQDTDWTEDYYTSTFFLSSQEYQEDNDNEILPFSCSFQPNTTKNEIIAVIIEV